MSTPSNKRLKNLIKRAANKAGFYAICSRRASYPGAAVLCYHNILTDRPKMPANVPNPFLHLSERIFERQMRFISTHFNPISAEQLASVLDGKASFPKRPVLVTFDDGYRGVFHSAKLILRKYGIPALVFITTLRDPDAPYLWFDLVYAYARIAPTRLNDLIEGRHAAQVPPKGPEEYAYDCIKKMISFPNQERLRILNAVLSDKDFSLSSVAEECRVMTREEIAILSAEGFGIGSHTCTHPILSKSTPDEQDAEIRNSKMFLEEITGKPVIAFAYPNGGAEDFADRTVDSVRRTGYRLAFTTIHGFNRSHADPYRLRRFFVPGDIPFHEFCHRLTFSWRSRYGEDT